MPGKDKAMLKKNRILLIIFFCILIYTVLSPGTLPVPAENLDIPAGIGTDLVLDEKGNKSYLATMDVYTFHKKDEIRNILIGGTDKNIPETREVRQLKSNHKFIYGLQKVMIFSEDVARNGIENSLDMLFTNQYMHDMGWLVICKGRAGDILGLKVDDYPASADYIKGMIDNCKEQNFFSENYKIMDAYVRVDAEGRSLILPYIEIKNGELQITGTAVFKKDRMVAKYDMKDTKIMNFLRENNTRGILTLQQGFDKQTAMYGTVKRKVSCQKTDDGHYVFNLDLEYTGDIISNTLYKDFLKKTDVIRSFEQSLAKDTEKKCYEFISKMQNEFKLDCLELGCVAAAKYGRGKVKDWNKVIAESEIKVNVTVKVDKFGRGQYTAKTE